MEIRTDEKFCIITPFDSKIDERNVLKLFDEITVHSDLKIGLDLSYIQDCTVEFFEMLKNIHSVGLFNIPSDIFALLNIMNLDKNVNLFVSELDFKADKHRVLNRKFSIV